MRLRQCHGSLSFRSLCKIVLRQGPFDIGVWFGDATMGNFTPSDLLVDVRDWFIRHIPLQAWPYISMCSKSDIKKNWWSHFSQLAPNILIIITSKTGETRELSVRFDITEANIENPKAVYIIMITLGEFKWYIWYIRPVLFRASLRLEQPKWQLSNPKYVVRLETGD